MVKTYTRRSADQIVAELEAKIASVKARAAAKQVKESADGSAFVTAVRGLHRAQRVAQKERNEALDRALEAALASLSTYAVERRLRIELTRRQVLRAVGDELAMA